MTKWSKRKKFFVNWSGLSDQKSICWNFNLHPITRWLSTCQDVWRSISSWYPLCYIKNSGNVFDGDNSRVATNLHPFLRWSMFLSLDRCVVLYQLYQCVPEAKTSAVLASHRKIAGSGKSRPISFIMCRTYRAWKTPWRKLPCISCARRQNVIQHKPKS